MDVITFLPVSTCLHVPHEVSLQHVHFSVCFEQPSTGMDATAKRQMWDLINQVSTERSVVLTTHSMEVSNDNAAQNVRIRAVFADTKHN